MAIRSIRFALLALIPLLMLLGCSRGSAPEASATPYAPPRAAGQPGAQPGSTH